MTLDSLGGREKGQSRDRALPQWVIDVIRPCVRVVSRALWRVELKGTGNIPAAGGLVIAANHQTYVDPFWITIPVRRPVRYLAWSEAFKNPILGRPMEWLGAWPLVVERGNPTAYRRSIKWLRGGGVLMIFPEGSRAGPRGPRWPRTGRVEITYHPVHRLTMLPGEDARHCAKRETEALAEIIRNK